MSRTLVFSAAESQLCPVCDLVFTDESELMRHSLSEHDVDTSGRRREPVRKKKKSLHGSHLISAGGTIFGRPHPMPGEPGWTRWLSKENRRQMTYILSIISHEEQMNAVEEFHLLWPRHGVPTGMEGLPVPINPTTLREMNAILALPNSGRGSQLARDFRERWRNLFPRTPHGSRHGATSERKCTFSLRCTQTCTISKKNST